MNVYDSGKIQALLEKDGYETVDDPEEADLVLVNTCSVREKPEHK
ncbi:MAG: tRNA (N6-isopentenyl adenosine(37)-C2)-methylthiotransferase MiaB, partial [Myxococcota bacterium]|nr:tRNA (N6-isopentenyl adenosine(37)-C2)-methylthiotransferase MiaB [Myxococcota bacterium]